MESPDIDTYVKEAELIEKMYMDLLDGTTRKRMKRIDDGSTGLQNVEYRICVINSKNELLQSALLQKYGQWYESCRSLFREYAGKSRNPKYQEFEGLNGMIITLIGLKDPVSNSNEKSDLKKEFRASFDIMVRILNSMEPLISLSKNDHENIVAIELVNSELDEAESLYVQGSVSSAVTIAANALDGYLRILCGMNGVEPEPEETMAAMVQLLHEADTKGLDKEMLGIIEHLVVLCDRCVTADKGEVSLEDEVRELIDRVRELVFLAFC